MTGKTVNPSSGAIVKRFGVSLFSGFCLTAVVFALHLIVRHYFPWTDKPMMPNFFTKLLLPGYRIGLSFSVNPFIQLAVAIIVDCFLFGLPVWLVLTVRRA